MKLLYNDQNLNFYEAKKDELTANQNLISKENLPQLNAFANAGYSNPGLNMLDNQFQEYVFVGLTIELEGFLIGMPTKASVKV